MSLIPADRKEIENIDHAAQDYVIKAWQAEMKRLVEPLVEGSKAQRELEIFLTDPNVKRHMKNALVEWADALSSAIQNRLQEETKFSAAELVRWSADGRFINDLIDQEPQAGDDPMDHWQQPALLFEAIAQKSPHLLQMNIYETILDVLVNLQL